jgi:hypothetical protein
MKMTGVVDVRERDVGQWEEVPETFIGIAGLED